MRIRDLLGFLSIYASLLMGHSQPPGDIMPTIIHSHDEEISVAYLRRDLQGFEPVDTPKKVVFTEDGEKRMVENLSQIDHDYVSIKPQTFLAPIGSDGWLMLNPYEELYPAAFYLKNQQVTRLKLPFKKGRPTTCFGVAAERLESGTELGYFLLSDAEPPTGEYYLEEPQDEQGIEKFCEALRQWKLEVWAYDLATGELLFKRLIDGPVRAHGEVKVSNLLMVDGALKFVLEEATPEGKGDLWYPLSLYEMNLKTRKVTSKEFTKVFQLSSLEITYKNDKLWCVYTSLPKVGALSEISIEQIDN